MKSRRVVISVLIIVVIGLMMVYSASNIWAGYKFNDSLYYIKRQGIFAVIGIIAMFIFSKIDYHIYLVDGLYPVDELIDILNIDIVSKNHNTISGYLIDTLGEIPDNSYLDKEIKINNTIFKIKSIKENRIDKIELILK